MSETDETGPKSIRAISRALRLLQTMNAQQISTVQSLHTKLKLPSPTVYRILQTLREEGYVVAEGTNGSYRLTAKVLELSAGYTEQNSIVEVASPIAFAVTKRIKWPLAIGTLDRDAIVVRYSTMPYSPVAVRTTTIGRRLGLLETAMGFAYLSFCPLEEREFLLELLRSSSTTKSLENEAEVQATIRRTCKQGYGLRLKSVTRQSATIAVPIMLRSNVIAILSMTTFGNSMNKKMIEQHAPILQETAREIELAFVANNPFNSTFLD